MRARVHKWVSVTTIVLLAGAIASSSAQVTVYRDSYGTPSVAADKLSDAVYGLGYAMAHDNAESMARNYKQARGRLAEVDGKTQLLTVILQLCFRASSASRRRCRFSQIGTLILFRLPLGGRNIVDLGRSRRLSAAF